MSNRGIFTSVAMNEANSNYRIAIHRESSLYKRDDDIRSEFARDYTRILHSMAYRRLKHKTQVFFNTHNDHICTRMEHVAHVESVSHTISEYLGLNTELTKAIAMGHDLGHAPFGHCGESVITDLSLSHSLEKFWHEKNGLRVVDKLELLKGPNKENKALNLTYAVRDGIICHCGEIDENAIFPRKDNIDLNSLNKPGSVQPFTWEGCIVKISDKIAYLGRDIEDAITLKIIEDDELSELYRIAQKYNYNTINTTVIMHEFIIDLIKNSSIENGICLSKEKVDFMNEIKQFNYKYIYGSEKLKYYQNYAALVIKSIFKELYQYSESKNIILSLEKRANDLSSIGNEFLYKNFCDWLKEYSVVKDSGLDTIVYVDLNDNKTYAQAIIDFISGMTDSYAIKCFNTLISF